MSFLLPEDVDVTCPWAPAYRPVPPITGRMITLPSSFAGPIAIMLPLPNSKSASQTASPAKLYVQE